MPTDLILNPTSKVGTKGRIYEVKLGDEILASGVSPEFNACRVLKDRGLTGEVRFWRPHKKTWDMSMSIEWAAGHTVSETDRGMRFTKWAPNPMFAKDDDVEEAEAA